jgi:hypothetical protein
MEPSATPDVRAMSLAQRVAWIYRRGSLIKGPWATALALLAGTAFGFLLAPFSWFNLVITFGLTVVVLLITPFLPVGVINDQQMQVVHAETRALPRSGLERSAFIVLIAAAALIILGPVQLRSSGWLVAIAGLVMYRLGRLAR